MNLTEQSQFDQVTDQLASGVKTEAELLAEWAASSPACGSEESLDRKPQARSYGSLEMEQMGDNVFVIAAGAKVRIRGLLGRKGAALE